MTTESLYDEMYRLSQRGIEYVNNKYPKLTFKIRNRLIEIGHDFSLNECKSFDSRQFIFGTFLTLAYVHTFSKDSPKNSDTIVVDLNVLNSYSKEFLTQYNIILLEEIMSEYLATYYKKEINVKFTVQNFINTFELLRKTNLEDMFRMKSFDYILHNYLYSVRENPFDVVIKNDSSFCEELDEEFLEDTIHDPYFIYLLIRLDVIKYNDDGRLFLTNEKQQVDRNHLKKVNSSLTQTLQLLCMSLIKPKNSTKTPPIYSQGKESEFIEWKGHYFRSSQEVEIAKELDSRQILFFPNAGCRVLEEKGMHTREIDFLVIIDGNMGILECDSERYHQSAARDHKRDGLFNAHGIWFIRRYTSQDCQDPKKVVDGFISDFEKFITHNKR
ncbi:MAG: hypothetical protein WBB43_23150 [Limnoraphis sp.]